MTKLTSAALLRFLLQDLRGKRVKRPASSASVEELTVNGRHLLVRSCRGRSEVFYRIEPFADPAVTKAFLEVLVSPPAEA